MNEEAVKKLAELSRLEITDSEIKEYTGEFSDILSYVDLIKEAVSDKGSHNDPVNSSDSSEDNDLILESASNRNVLREDEEPAGSGLNTEKILESAPNIADNYLKVKKIL